MLGVWLQHGFAGYSMLQHGFTGYSMGLHQSGPSLAAASLDMCNSRLKLITTWPFHLCDRQERCSGRSFRCATSATCHSATKLWLWPPAPSSGPSSSASWRRRSVLCLGNGAYTNCRTRYYKVKQWKFGFGSACQFSAELSQSED